MYPLFKCSYCNFIDSEEKVKEHEVICMYNYDRKSCYTCEHKKIKSENTAKFFYECKIGKEIPKGKILEFCPQYNKKQNPDNLFDGIFSGLFGR